MRSRFGSRGVKFVVFGCLAGFLTMLAPHAIAQPLPLDAFVKYRVKRNASAPKFFRFGPVDFDNRLTGSPLPYVVRAPRGLFVPADLDGGGIADAATHLLEYRANLNKCCAHAQAGLAFFKASNACGDVGSFNTKPESVLIPVSKSLTGPVSPPGSHDLDHFVCFKTRRQKPLPKGTQVTVSDQFAIDKRYDLLKVTGLCLPADKSETPSDPSTILSGPQRGALFPVAPATIGNPDRGLICYKARRAGREIPQVPAGCGCDTAVSPKCDGPKISQTKPPAVSGVHTTGQLGAAIIDVRPRVTVCLPAVLTGGIL